MKEHMDAAQRASLENEIKRMEKNCKSNKPSLEATYRSTTWRIASKAGCLCNSVDGRVYTIYEPGKLVIQITTGGCGTCKSKKNIKIIALPRLMSNPKVIQDRLH